MDNNKKTALVIGGNGGIGCSATKQLIKDGFSVCATYFRNQNNLQEILSKESNTDKLSLYALDARKGEKIIEVISEIRREFQKIDVVIVTVSSVLHNTRMLDLDWNQYITNFEIQLKPLHFTIKALDEQIRSKTKTKFIVLLTEYCLSKPPKGLAHYITAKYAALGFSKVIATELAQYGCTCNMISPGMVETPLLENLPAKLIEMTAYENPLKRNATTEDVSSVISFLASDKSDFLNGLNITVNGGGVIA